jgi:hypothetical protein
MREELEKMEGYTCVFTARCIYFGYHTNKLGCHTRVRLGDVKHESGILMTDSLWFTCGVRWHKIRPVENDIVRFKATVTKYHNKFGCGFRLSNPTKIEIVTSEQETLFGNNYICVSFGE